MESDLKIGVRCVSSTRFDARTGPPNPDGYSVWLDVELVAEQDHRQFGGEMFSVRVCDPKWLSMQVGPGRYAWGHATLVTERWDLALVEAAIASLCAGIQCKDWPSAVVALSRFLKVDTIDMAPDGW